MNVRRTESFSNVPERRQRCEPATRPQNILSRNCKYEQAPGLIPVRLNQSFRPEHCWHLGLALPVWGLGRGLAEFRLELTLSVVTPKLSSGHCQLSPGARKSPLDGEQWATWQRTLLWLL